MKNILKYILTFFFLFACIAVYPRSYSFRGLSLTEGLSDLVVNAIYKDSLGYVWIGTGNSLERFDGIHIKHYLIVGDDEKLKRVNVITEMPDNQIWMGNGMGLWRLNEEKNDLEPIARETINHGVHSLLHDGKGTLYIGTEAGLFIYRKGNIKKILIDPNVLSSANSIAGLNLGEDGVLWLATGNGLYSLQLSNEKINSYHNVVNDKHVCSFNNIARVGSKLYMGTMGQGIISFDIHSKTFERFVDVGCNVISSLSSDGRSLLYVGTDGNGVHFVSTDKKKIIRSMRHETGKDDTLRSNSVYSVLVDRDGLIWVGFYQQGLDYTLYQSGLFSTYTYSPFFNSKDMSVRALVIREREKLIGSRDGLFYIDEKNHRFKSFKIPQLRSNMIFCCLFYQGEYYIGTYGGGMYILNPQTLMIRDFESDGKMPFSKGHIFCIKQDYDNNLWIGTSMGIFCYKDGKRIAHYTSANSKLPDGNVYEIYFDSTQKGWVCTENGMCIWDPSTKTLKTDVFPEGFIDKEKIRVVYEDSNHDLYFFPDKGALFISDLSMTTFRRLPPGTPLEGNDGMFVIEDNEKWLWFGTNNGLIRYDKKDNFIPYNFVDGIPSPIFTLCPPVHDSKGGIWFGNSKGLLYWDAVRMNKKKLNNYFISITDVYVNGKSTLQPVFKKSNQTEILLEPSQKNVTFCFSDFSYTSHAFMAYEYQLVGEDTNWVAVTGRSDATYYDLPSGTYTFKVRRMGDPDSEMQMTVKIASSISIWGILFIVITVVTGKYCFWGQRKKRMERKRKEQVPDSVKVTEKKVQPVEGSHIVVEEKYKTNKVSIEECKRLVEKLEIIMHKEKPYTNPNLKIADLAVSIGTSSHTLSYLFNQYLNRNYYDYINDYRIAEFKRLVEKDEYAKYTLSALAELCGFSSRASFFRYFKKATNITPNEYIRSIGKNNE